MRLLKIKSVKHTLDELKQFAEKQTLQTEKVYIDNALSRILSEHIISEENIPSFNRSTVDGYAVISKDVAGASESIPVFLECIEVIEMGNPSTKKLQPGQTSYIPTGGMIPENADAVVMVEYSEQLSDNEIAITSPIALGANIMKIGDDIKSNDIILSRGRKLKPQDIGTLAALGKQYVDVYTMPRVSIISTGDEIIPINQKPNLSEVRDINGYALSSLCKDLGCTVVTHKIIKDDYNTLLDEVRLCKQTSDIILLSGGSSVGTKDMTSSILKELTNTEPLVHGLAIKPGKPTIISLSENNIFFGLPGHPASAIVVFLAVVKPYINFLLRVENALPKSLDAYITSHLHASDGKEVYQMVSVTLKDNNYYATPIYAKSGSISTLSKADGYIVVPENTEGIFKDSLVRVFLF